MAQSSAVISCLPNFSNVGVYDTDTESVYPSNISNLSFDFSKVGNFVADISEQYSNASATTNLSKLIGATVVGADGVSHIIDGVFFLGGAAGEDIGLSFASGGWAAVPATALAGSITAAGVAAIGAGTAEIGASIGLYLSALTNLPSSPTSVTIKSGRPISVTSHGRKMQLRVDYEQISDKVHIQDNLGSNIHIRFDVNRISNKDDVMNALRDADSALSKALGDGKKSSGPWTEIVNRVWTAVQRVKGS